MQRSVQVSVTGIQMENGEEASSTQTLSYGIYEKREEENLHILVFDEMLEGIDEPLRNTLVISPEEVSLSKVGEVETEMLFKIGSVTLFSFGTAYGSLSMEIACFRIEIKETEDKFYTEIHYQLQTEGSVVSHNRIRIEAVFTEFE